MFRTFKHYALALVLLLTPSATLTSCDEDSDSTNWLTELLEFILGLTGWNMDTEDVTDQEVYDVIDDDEVGDLPSSIDLSSYFPPIGNQGSYGTCVAWSSGYALKTALDAKTNGYTSTQLKTTTYQCSAVDLWHLIPTSGKSTKCNGSNFEPALEAMVSSGCGSVASYPFTNSKMTCDGVTGGGNTKNKLKGYRVIAYTSELSGSSSAGMSLSNFKYWLSQGYPILIGAKLGENFMAWNSSSVLTDDTEDYQGQHAYHAIVVTGYSDTKQAFRIRNSWGADDWGDDGCIWVGYSFFLKQFVFGAWIAYNSDQVPSTTSSASLKASTSNDLSAHVYSDVENADGTRTLTYNIENTGASSISSSKKWSVVYMIYNSKNINDRAILFEDIYSSDKSTDNSVALYKSQAVASSVSLQSGETVAEAQGGSKLQFTYKLPESINGKPLDGKYFMALIVNPFDGFSESDMVNNVSYVTANNMQPLVIYDGKVTNMPSSLSDVRDLTSVHRNTYEPNELLDMLSLKFKHGKLQKCVIDDESSLRSSKPKRVVVD